MSVQAYAYIIKLVLRSSILSKRLIKLINQPTKYMYRHKALSLVRTVQHESEKAQSHTKVH